MVGIIGLIALAVCIGYFVYTGKMNKNAKNCSCGKKYSYVDGDIVNYYKKAKDELQTPLGKMQALVTVQLKCSKCGATNEKKIRVTYDPALKETVEDGVRRFF